MHVVAMLPHRETVAKQANMRARPCTGVRGLRRLDDKAPANGSAVGQDYLKMQ